MTETNQIEFGALLTDGTVEPCATLPAATDALIRARRKGQSGAVVQRQEGGAWTHIHTGQTAEEWLESQR